jgi:GNAT superfamily N-acetyltransferase
MNVCDLSLKMRRLTQWLDGRCQPERLVRRQFDGPPYGHCYVTVDPERQGPFPSANLNRVYLCGCDPAMSPDGVARLIDLFRAEGVRRFFIWLSPGPDMDAMRARLTQHGLLRARRTGYPTLWRTDPCPVHFETDLVVREVSTEEIDAARDWLGDTLWPEYARSAGRRGFVHYMAFDDNLPVAIAALCVFEDIGYLLAATTAESHRRRGAQQALIAKRVDRAEQMGCSVQVSETMYMLEHSFRNLQRAGFREAYEKEVYEWTAA